MRWLQMIAVVVASVGLMASTATMSAADSTGGAQATFGGQTIDLASGWGGAQACLVGPGAGVVECFATVAEMKAAEATLGLGSSPVPAAGSASPAASCTGDVELFSGASYTGRELDDWDDGVWANLSVFGFADTTVSFQGGACQFYLAQGTNGSGSWYPGYTGPYGASPNMGLYWNDTIQSVYIV